MEPIQNRQIKLRDGRSTGYVELGDPHGKPVLFLHGYPSTLRECDIGLAKDLTSTQF